MTLEQLLERAEKILSDGDALRIDGAIYQVAKNLSIDEIDELIAPTLNERQSKRWPKYTNRAKQHLAKKENGEQFDGTFIQKPSNWIEGTLLNMYRSR